MKKLLSALLSVSMLCSASMSVSAVYTEDDLSKMLMNKYEDDSGSVL